MPFFEPPPLPPPQEPAARPEWMGPPRNVLGTPVPLAVTLARTGDVAVAITGALVFPTGAELRLVTRRRTPGPLGEVRHAPPGRLPEDLLRFGVRFADGRKATTTAMYLPAAGATPPGPILRPRGGMGDELAYELDLWLWPLPPPGPMALVLEWPSEGIPLTERPVDTAPLLDAAARATVLWEPVVAQGGWAAY